MLKTKHNLIAIGILGIALAIVIVVVGGVSWHRASAPVTQPQTAENSSPTTATSTTTSTLAARVYTPNPPHGSVTYQIAQAATQLPGFVQATIDPVDVSVGQVQHFTIITDDPNPIVSVVAEITTDHKVVTVPLVSQGTPSVSMLVPRTIAVDSDNRLALISPDQAAANLATADVNTEAGAHVANAATANDTKFTGQWTVEDTHTAKYQTEFIAKDSAGNTNSVTLGWTDPLCPFTSVNNYNGGTATITSSCTMPYNSTGVSNVDGPENGNLSVSNGATLTISSRATLIFNNNGTTGYSMLFPGVGTVAVASGAQIIFKENMCATDNDGDGYMATSTWTPAASCGAMPPRTNFSASMPFGDCNDSNANVHPGQTAYFTTSATTDLGANTYDYNCDGALSYSNSTGTATLSSTGGCNSPSTCSSPMGTLGYSGWVGCGGYFPQVVDQGYIAVCPNGITKCDIWSLVVSGLIQGCH
jgi:hypothetical protein